MAFTPSGRSHGSGAVFAIRSSRSAKRRRQAANLVLAFTAIVILTGFLIQLAAGLFAGAH